MKKPAIVVALISAAGIVGAALIGIYPSLRREAKVEAPVAGIVVDQQTNRGIPQASIALAGRAEQYITEDTGNFRIELKEDTPRASFVSVAIPGFLLTTRVRSRIQKYARRRPTGPKN